MKPTYKQLNDSAVREHQFALIQVDYLLSVLEELKTFSGSLEIAVIDNAIKRHELDKCIHAKLLFNK